MSAPTPILAIFDIGGPEVLLIMLVALLLFGTDRLPEVARGVGKALREVRKAASGLEEEMKRAMEEPPPSPRKAVPGATPRDPAQPQPGAEPPPPTAPSEGPPQRLPPAG